MSLPFGFDLRVDPARGDDIRNDGTAAAPLKTIHEAFKRCEAGWRHASRISLAPGKYDLGKNPVVRVPGGAGIGAEPLLLRGDLEDSSLGDRAVGAGSSAGAGAEFGSVIDAAGGLIPDAWRGYLLEFQSGAPTLAGQQYIIASNTASAFTIAGAMPVAPAAGDKFVVKGPAASIVWTGNLEIAGALLGLLNLRFHGPGGVNTHLAEIAAYTGFVWLEGTGLRVGPGASLKTIRSTPSLFSGVGDHVFATSHAGIWFHGAGIWQDGSATVDLRGSILSDASVVLLEGGFYQNLDGAAFGASSLRAQNSSTIALARFRLAGVSAADFAYGVGGASILAVSNSEIYLEDVDLSGCAADPIAGYDGSVIGLHRVSGTGNTGAGSVGVRLRRGTVARNNGGNTLTAAAGDIQIGALPAASTWATAASLTTDQSVTPCEFCLIGP